MGVVIGTTFIQMQKMCSLVGKALLFLSSSLDTSFLCINLKIDLLIIIRFINKVTNYARKVSIGFLGFGPNCYKVRGKRRGGLKVAFHRV